VTTEPTTIVGDLVAELEKAWGDADGAGYCVHFTDGDEWKIRAFQNTLVTA
jgi:hypothetical protein